MESTSIFTLYNEDVNWNTAKSRCEEDGQRLAVPDTTDKLTALKRQLRIKTQLSNSGVENLIYVQRNR